jgi:hypothetical protein
MASWCTADEVAARVRGNPPAELLQEFADRATSLLFVLSGRRYRGRAMVMAAFQVDSRGYVKMNAWVPVQQIVSSTVPINLLPGGTTAVVSPRLAYTVVSLTFEYGEDPPASGRDAAAALAAEMLRGDSRYADLVRGTPAEADIRPSSRITSIARQGVTYSFADPGALARENLTGVYETDLFLRAANPTGMRHQPKVVAP